MNSHGTGPLQPKSLRVRCPHCHNPIELVEDSPLEDIECPSCGSHFNLLGAQSTASYHPEGTKKIGRFELTQQVGIGHYGSVWKARDTELDRTVAVKIPRKDQLNQAEAEQFLREARAAAQIRHSNIVSIHEVGREDDSIYIVSDFVDGANLREWLSGQQLTPREAAGLCVKIADALHEAHEAGVVHRDLKPSNIMIDIDGEPYITDFGLAKRETGEITITVDGRILGTPAYMSPEQARGEGHQADRRTDVYSLGVILFELLAGELPFRGTERMLIVQILREEPPRPRKFDGHIPRDLETISLKCLEKDPSRRYATARDLAEDLGRYLKGEPIRARPIGRCQRLWRWSKRQPVVAGLGALVIASLLVGTVVSAYFAVKAYDRAEQEALQRKEAERQTRQANSLRLAGESREALSEEPERSVLLAAEAMTTTLGSGEPPPLAAGQALRAAIASVKENAAERVLKKLDWPVGYSPSGAVCSPDCRWLFTWSIDGSVRRWDLTLKDPSVKPVLLRASGKISGLKISPDGRWLVALGPGDARMWDLTAPDMGGTSIRLRLDRSGSIFAVRRDLKAVFSPDGRWLITMSGAETCSLWDLRGGSPPAAADVLPVMRSEVPLFSSDGNWLVVPRETNGYLCLNLSLKDPVATPVVVKPAWFKPIQRGMGCQSVFSPDCRWLVLGCPRGLTLLDLSAPTLAEKNVPMPPTEGGYSVNLPSYYQLAISPDSRWLAVSVRISESLSKPLCDISVWDLKGDDVAEKPALRREVAEIDGITFSPDSRWMAADAHDRRPEYVRSVLLWDMKTRDARAEPHTLEGTLGPFSHDGHWVVNYCGSAARVWNLTAKDPWASPVTLRQDQFMKSALFTPNGQWLITGNWERMGFRNVCLWNLRAHEPFAKSIVLSGHVTPSYALVMSRDGRWLVTSDAWNSRVWDLSVADPSVAPIVLHGYEEARTPVALSQGGRWLVTTDLGKAHLWDRNARAIASGPIPLGGHTDSITCVAASADDQWVVTGSRDGRVSLWDLSSSHSAKKRIMLSGHEAAVTVAAFSPDARWLITGSKDKTLRLWKLAARDVSAEPAVLQGHQDEVYALAISPDSQWGASVDRAEFVFLWDLTAPNPLASVYSLRHGLNNYSSMIMGQDPMTHRLITAGDPLSGLWNDALSHALRTARIDVTPPGKRLELLRKRVPSARKFLDGRMLSWSPDGKRVVFVKHGFDTLQTLNLQTGKTTDLVGKGQYIWFPAWSPNDGKLIAFTRADAGKPSATEVWLVEATGSNARKVADGGGSWWSRDGKTLLFSSTVSSGEASEGKKLMLKAIRVDIPDAEVTDAYEVSGCPSSDGRLIAYLKDNELLIESRQSNAILRRVPLKGWSRLLAAWSPDGKRIAFGSTLEDKKGLRILNIESGQLVKLPDGAYTSPAWSPDGTKLAFEVTSRGARVGGVLRTSATEIWTIETKDIETRGQQK